MSKNLPEAELLPQLEFGLAIVAGGYQ